MQSTLLQRSSLAGTSLVNRQAQQTRSAQVSKVFSRSDASSAAPMPLAMRCTSQIVMNAGDSAQHGTRPALIGR